ncbi:NAD-dependent epimerase/dehydratase family protein [Rhodococcus aerolatus]
MALHVVVGKGPVGSGTAERLAAAGHEVRVLSRSGGTSRDGVEHRVVDAADADALVAATRGAATITNAVNPPYTSWATDWPPVAAALLAAAERHDAVLVTMGNLYGYGRPTGPMTPDTPMDATDTKGRVRARMWREMVAAHAAGRVRVTEARASDFVGPTVPAAQSHLNRQVPTVRRGGRVWVFGNPDARRSWSYLPDVVSTLVTLGADERAWGRAWMVPSTVRTQREAVGDLARAAGVEPGPVSAVPWAPLRLLSPVVPFLRELVDVRHQFDAEFVLDASATTRTFGQGATPWEQVVAATVARDPARVG